MGEDVSLNEMENTFPTQMQVLPDGSISQQISGATNYWYIIRIVLVFVSFVMGLSLMNLFIAVLTVSYTAASKKANAFFLRHRARKVVQNSAMHVGWSLMAAPLV